MLNKDHDCLVSILESIVKIEDYLEGINAIEILIEDSRTFDAVMMNFIVIGEMVAKLTDDFKNDHSDIEWWKIKGLRDIVAHDYFGIDVEEIWQIIQNKLSELKTYIESVIH